MAKTFQGFLKAPDGTVLNGTLRFVARQSDSASDLLAGTAYEYTLQNTGSYNYALTLIDGTYQVQYAALSGVWKVLGNITVTAEAPGDLLALLGMDAASGHVLALADLADVTLTGALNGQVLTWNADAQRWYATGGGYRPVRVITGASYVLTAEDAGSILHMEHGSTITLILPATLSAGLTYSIVQQGVGVVQFAAASGATLLHRQGHGQTAGQYAVATLFVMANTSGSNAVYTLGGDTAVTPQAPSSILVVTGGQSLARGHVYSQESNNNAGEVAFEATLAAYFPATGAINLFNGAEGGTYASRKAYNASSQTTDYWWDDVSVPAVPGGSLNDFYTLIAAEPYALTDIAAVLWAQGEADCFYIPGTITRAEYKAAVLAVFNHMRAGIGNHLHIIIQPIGRRTTGTPSGLQEVREVQWELAQEYNWITLAAEIYDQPLYDHVHPSDAGYTQMGKRNALQLAAQMGASVPYAAGPSVTEIILTGVSLTVTLAHDGGTAIAGAADKTPAAGKKSFFRVHDADGVEIPITAVTVIGTNTVAVTMAYAPLQNITVYGGYGVMQDIDMNALITDNSPDALPLRTFKQTVTAGITNLQGLFACFDAAQSGTVLNGANVEQWNDISGNNNHALKSGSNPVPTKVTKDGHPALYSIGAGNTMLDFTNPLATATPFTVFCRVKVDTATADPTTGSSLNTVMAFASASSAQASMTLNAQRDNAADFSFAVHGTGSTADNDPFTDWFTCVLGFDGTKIYAYFNGVADGSSDTNAVVPLVSHLGGRLFNDLNAPANRAFIGWARTFGFSNRWDGTAQALEIHKALQGMYS